MNHVNRFKIRAMELQNHFSEAGKDISEGEAEALVMAGMIAHAEMIPGFDPVLKEAATELMKLMAARGQGGETETPAATSGIVAAGVTLHGDAKTAG